MSDNRALALQAKARGNAAFSAKDFPTAIKEFTEAIGFDSNDHVFFSNRSACHASLGDYEKALEDGEKCISIKPTWAKGYLRKGLALYELTKFGEAEACYAEGLKLDANNASLKEGYELSKKAQAAPPNPMAQMFGPQMWAKLAQNPVTREYLNDPAFVQKLKMLQSNPQAIGSLSGDPKISQCLGVILGIGANFGSASPEGGPGAGPFKETTPDDNPYPETKREPEPTPEPEPEPEPEFDEEELAEQKKKADALQQKDLGNAAYKKRNFEEALVHYKKAAEIDAADPVFHLNIAAVKFAQKLYDECISTCQEALKIGKANRSDYAIIAKAHTRIGNAQLKLNDLDAAITSYKESLLNKSNPAVKRALKKAEENKKVRDAQNYLDDDKALEHKAKGNEFFKQQKWVEAINEYTESLKRNPKLAAVYSNRAACYTKLMTWEKGLKDCDTCLEIDPTFVKAYIRKGRIQHFLKQYHKALQTYDEGLKLSPDCTDLLQGRNNTRMAIQRENSSGKVDPQRAAEAMKDPEIVNILQDPTINKILREMQDNPQAAQRAMADPVIRGKIEKLVQAGVLQVG